MSSWTGSSFLIRGYGVSKKMLKVSSDGKKYYIMRFILNLLYNKKTKINILDLRIHNIYLTCVWFKNIFFYIFLTKLLNKPHQTNYDRKL